MHFIVCFSPFPNNSYLKALTMEKFCIVINLSGGLDNALQSVNKIRVISET